MNNNVIKLNELENMSNEELEVIQNKIKETRLKKAEGNINLLLDNFEKIKEENKGLKLDIDKIKNDFKEQSVKVDYLKDEYSKIKNHPEKMKELKKAVKSRVNSFFSKRDTNNKQFIEYILFYNKYIAGNGDKDNIYQKIFDVANVQASGEIYEDDLPTVLLTIKRWIPSYGFKMRILNKYRKENEKGMLDDKHKIAYEEYLELTNGGNDIAIQ